MKALIVDDSANMRRMLASRIEDRFDSIFECADGSDAVTLYQQHRPDLVLMDWQMADVDGITATRKIVAEFPSARIFLITTFDDESLRDEAFAAGACGFVLKRSLAELDALI